MKIILVGDSGVGKSCLVYVLGHGRYINDMVATTCAAFTSKTIEVNQQPVKMQIWDTAGQEVYRCVMKSYYRDADVCLICFNKDSVDSFKDWHDTVKEIVPDCSIIGVITKSDLYTDESLESMYEQIQVLKDAGDVDFEAVIATSARYMIGIDDVFMAAAKYGLEKPRRPKFGVPLSGKDTKGCC